LKGIRHFNLTGNEFLKDSVKSFVALLKGICNATGQEYIPQVSPHHRLPFWEKFREEVINFAHSNHEHTFLMNVISEFAEYYRKDNYQLAYEAISFFVASCIYLIPEYKMVYPFIVKAVIEQDLGLIQKAGESYKNALKNNHNNPDTLGGLGMVYLGTGDYNKAIQYFEKAYLLSEGNQRINERLNLIITKISGGETITHEEKEFVKKLDYLDVVLDDEKETGGKNIISEKSGKEAITDQLKQRFEEQRIFILTTKALLYYVEASSKNEQSARELLQKAYTIYADEIGEAKLPNAVSVFYFYTISKYLGKPEPEKIYERAISRFDRNKSEIKELYGFLSDHYYQENKLNKSILIYRNHMMTGTPGRKILASYARLLKASGSIEYKDVCSEILDYDLNGYPETAEDYYWDGYANFLLGNPERAQYDFERSFHFDVYYNLY
jgi:tetratricopeptide (TPR) repeat protein